MKNNIKISLILASLISSLYAQNSYTLETINVTSSLGTSIDQKDITDSATIITKDDIQESRVTNLAEALSRLGNIPMVQNGAVGTNSSFFLRGMDSSRTLVLIDGVRYNDPTNIGAAAQFEQIMLYNVDQIEIIKGAQSGVWGADATAGVINIITSKPKKGLHAAVNAEYGSYNSIKTSLQTSYATDKYDLTIGGILYNTDGFSAVEPKKSEADYGKRYDELGLEKDAYDNKSLNAKLGINLTENDRVEAGVQSINSLSHSDSGAGITGDSKVPQTTLQNRFYTLALKHKDSINDLKLQYNLSDFHRDYISSSYTHYRYIGSVDEYKLDDKIKYLQNSFVRVGGSYQKFEQKEITANTNKSFDAKSVFLTNYNKFEMLSGKNTIVTESVRYDKYNNFDDSFTGKVGVKQFIHNDIYVSANVGTGFNAPTLGELYGQWGANPDLKPEKSFTSDLTLGNDTLWVTGFYNEIKDLIEYDMTTWAYVQASGKAKFRGIELGYKDYFFDSIGVNAMYTYIEAKNVNGEALARRPKNQIDASVIYYVSDDFDLGINAQYIGTRYDSADNQGAQTGEYAIANFVTNIKVNNNVTFYGKIDNLTDEYYQTVDGYATAGRSLYLGLNAKF
ncbi:TonB-dependent receptor [Sulfurimonas sp. HSL3-2]|uniref:TonB-dependent receptor plug domain-containing protein n=1 Tax=Hydrocurvibacter mobilis TaxID=3131936 RepID=UPI0031F9095F